MTHNHPELVAFCRRVSAANMPGLITEVISSSTFETAFAFWALHHGLVRTARCPGGSGLCLVLTQVGRGLVVKSG